MCSILVKYIEQAVMCEKEVLMSLATKIQSIKLQRAEDLFPVLKESLVSVTSRTGIYQLIF